MKGSTAAIGSAVGFLLLQSAQAETYTPPTTQACRAEPLADAKMLRQLRAGEAITVLTERDGWRQVQAGPFTCWVEHQVQSEVDRIGVHGGDVNRTAHPVTIHRRASVVRHVATAHHAVHSGMRRHRASGSSGGGCSCGARHVCVGPRGGRYCITSGGNKRYGV